MRVPRSIVALTWAGVACSPPPVAPSPPPPGKPAPAPPKAVPAELSFPFQPFRALQTWTVADGSLQIGPLGRRALVKDGALREGPALPESIVGVLRLGGNRLGFVGASATTYVTEGPLGPVVERREGPPIEARSVAVGAQAVVVVGPRDVQRSIDGGRTWTRVEIKGARGVLGGVALSAKGEGLLYAMPQRVFGSTDDGATWSVVDSLGLGVERVGRDGPGEAAQVELVGLGARATFVGGKLVPNNQAAAPWVSGPWYETRLGGPWVLIAKHDEGVFTHFLGRLGETFATTKLPAGCSGPNAIGDDAGLWVSCPGDGTLLRWTKAAGWKTVRAFPGSIDRDELDLAGDGPIVFQGRACEDAACGPRKLSFDGGATFVDVTLAAKGTVHAAAFDPNSHQGYVVAESDGRLAIHVAAPGSATFARTSWLDLDAKTHGGARATVDADGVLRVGVCRADGSACRLQAIRAGVSEPPRWLGPTKDLALVGRRGLWVDDKGVAFETADGGVTWARVALPAEREEVVCSAYGCVRHNTLRAGWDLPALALPTVAAALVEPPPAPAPPKKPVRRLTCTSSGAVLPAAVPPDLLEHHDGFSWIEAGKDGAVTAKIARDKVSTVPLLPPEKKGTVVHRVVDGVAVRVTSTTTTLFAPRVDLAWIPAGATKPVHATIPKLVQTHEHVGVIAGSRVQGGVVLHFDDRVLLADDKGKVQPLEIDPFDSFARVGSGFVGARVVGATIALSWSGAPPGRARWRLQPYRFEPPFGRLVAGSEGVFVGGLVDEQPYLVAVPSVRLGDPIEVRTLDPGVDVSQSPCLEPFAGATVPSADPREPSTWEVVVDGVPIPALLTLRPEKGKVCAVAVVGAAAGQRVRVSLATKDRGWLIGKDGLRPLTCQ